MCGEKRAGKRKDMKTASIIVPVYKIQEAYLRQCIDSLRTQTLEDIEIILIDDGSPDNCGEICDAYAREDTRIRVIHQENQGVSVARNAGLDIAQGKWLTFVDADDWLELDALERLVDAAERLDVEALYCGAYQEWENHTETGGLPFEKEKILIPEEKDRLYIYTFKATENLFFSAGVTWGKLYLRKSLADFRFPIGIALGEDAVFSLLALMHMQRIACLGKNLYHYRVRLSSAEHRYREDRVEQATKTSCRLYEILQDGNVNFQVWNAYYLWLYGKMQEIVSTQYFHPDCPLAHKQRAKACAGLFSRHPYVCALEKAEAETVRQRIGLFLFRKHMYRVFMLLFQQRGNIRAWKNRSEKTRRSFA